jgi:integrase
MTTAKTVGQVAAEEQRLLRDIKTSKTPAGEVALKALFALAEANAEVAIPGIDEKDATPCRKAGIQPRTKVRKGKKIVVAGRKLHDFRRTATRNLSRAGVGEAVVRSITGHKTSSMFHRYSITTGEDQRAALEALARREE